MNYQTNYNGGVKSYEIINPSKISGMSYNINRGNDVISQNYS